MTPNARSFAKNLGYRLQAKKVIVIAEVGQGDFFVQSEELGEYLPRLPLLDDPKLSDQLTKGPIRAEELAGLLATESDLQQTIVVLEVNLDGYQDVDSVLKFVSLARHETSGVVVAISSRNRQSSSEIMVKLLQSHGLKPLMHGLTYHSDSPDERDVFTAFLNGRQSSIKTSGIRPVSALAIVPFYNESDIISQTVRNLLDAGCAVHLIDNWSTDDSHKLVRSEFGSDPRVKIERFPWRPSKNYEWTRILNRMSEVAAKATQDWILHVDADEIVASPLPEISLLEFLAIADASGYNVIDFTVLNFRPYTNEGQIYLDRWEFGLTPGLKIVERAFKKQRTKVDLASSGGHVVNMPNRKVFPINLILQHFPLRSPEQARKKIFLERNPRTQKEQKKYGFHTHYTNFSVSDDFLWDELALNSWDNDTITRWMAEFTTKFGLGFFDTGAQTEFPDS